MPAKRDIARDLAAVILLALVIFLAVSLATYDPADPVAALTPPLNALYTPDVLSYPQNEVIRNACGRSGALVGQFAYRTFGITAWYVIASVGVVSFLMLRRAEFDTPLIRTLGWFASLVGVVTLIGMFPAGLLPGPLVGSGGWLGAASHKLMSTHFAAGGSFILSLGLLAGGLLLASDYALFRIAADAGRASKHGAAAVKRALPRVWTTGDPAEMKNDGKRLRTDLEDPIKIEEAEESEPTEENAAEEGAEKEAMFPSISFFKSPKPVDPPTDDQPVEEVAAEEEKEVVVEETPSSPPAPHFKIKKPKPKSEREQVIDRLNESSELDDAGEYELPPIDMLIEGDDVCFDEQEKEIRRKAIILQKTFAEFGFNVTVTNVESGPVIAQYEIELEAGLRLSKITGLADDLAIALRVPNVRIVAPIPGKNTVGIEVPNEMRQVVRMRDVMEEAIEKTRKMSIPIFLGKDVSGNALSVDLAKMPHLLIAGRTGTGKSVCLNSIISSILMTRRPDEVRMLMIDPKVVELSGYGRLPHLMHPVVTDMKKAEAILAWAVEKMEERYSLLAQAGVRHITSYNQLGEDELYRRLELETEEDRETVPSQLPFIVIVADEMADLMMQQGKEVEQHIIRLAQKSRAVGIHLILATQKPTVDVITGLIKSNLPARISFQVASRTDSRVVLDEMGADKLLGNGDMLFLWPGTSKLLRGQGTYLSDDEIDAITDFCSTGEQNFVKELVNLKADGDEDEDSGSLADRIKKRDELYESAVDIVVREGRGSLSLLQRCLGIGYGRAARMIDWMAEDKIVGEYAGSQAREVLVSLPEWEAMQGLEPSEADGGELPAEDALDHLPYDEADDAYDPSGSSYETA